MPKVSEEYRDGRREQIAAAAMRAFHRKGFQATSMADIIAESGLSAGAIYGHFKSKSDIVLSVAQRIVGARIDEIAELANRQPIPPPANLIRVLMSGMLHDLGRPGMLVQLWGEAMTEPAIRELAVDVFTRMRAVFRHYLTGWYLQQGRSAEEAAALGDEQMPLFVATAQGYILQSALLPDFDGEAFLSAAERYLPR